MSMLSPRHLLPTLLPSLNALLVALDLPFTLDHPTDLTPSLLLAIFESLISARLPIPASVRQSRTQDAKARAMLVLLGVLECDVLRGGIAAADAEHSVAASNADDSALGGAGGVSVDGWVDEIGLGEVDPERLADGGWEETIFVGELLCWLARRKGILPRTKSSHRSSHPRSLYSNHHSYGTEEGETADFSSSLLLRPSPARSSWSPRSPSPSPSIPNSDVSALSHISDIPRHPLVHSPEPSLSASATTGTDLSIRARSVSSRTSISNTHDDPDELEEASQDTLHMYDPRQMMQEADDDDDHPPMFRPRCIHELEDPSYIQALAGPSSSFCPSVSHDHVSKGDTSSRDEDDDTDEQDNDDPYAPPTPTPQRVRLTGWIDSVDAATELSHFAASRSHSDSRSLSRPPVPNAHAGSGPSSGPPSRSLPPSRGHARSDEPSRPTSRLNPAPPGVGNSRARRRVSPPPPRLASPSPPLSPPRSARVRSRRQASPPSPPSHTTDSDPAFDVSFSSLNNTSTPAKFRAPRRPPSHTTTRHEMEADPYAGMGSTRTAAGRPHAHRDRSSPYTPSPPSFSTGAAGKSAGTRADVAGSSVHRARPAAPTSGATTTTKTTAVAVARTRRSVSPPLHVSSIRGKSPPLAGVEPAGTTATTNTLLTERARLLTELAALKRTRAAIDSGGARAAGARNGGSSVRTVGPHVGVRV